MRERAKKTRRMCMECRRNVKYCNTVYLGVGERRRSIKKKLNHERIEIETFSASLAF